MILILLFQFKDSDAPDVDVSERRLEQQNLVQNFVQKEHVDLNEPFELDQRFLHAIRKSQAPPRPKVRFGGDPRFHGVWGSTGDLSEPWIEEGFEVSRDDTYDVLFSRYTKKKSTKMREQEVHNMGVGTRVFSHCHTLLGIAGNKCSFSLYLDAIREELGEEVMSRALIKSYVYPHQRAQVLDLLNDSPSWSQGRLIFKSCLGKRGVGLEVVSRVEDLPTSGFEESSSLAANSESENEESWATRTVFGRRIKADWMVQPYLYRPLLLENRRKFHLRLYVVVNWHPLQVFLYRDGLALFASETYEPDENIDDEDVLATRRTMHLTNSAINMNVHRDDETEPQETMWSVRSLENELGQERFETIWSEIQNAATQLFCNWDSERTDQDRKRRDTSTVNLFVDAVSPLQRNCFDLYGMDVIIRDDDVPLVMELNKMPSLAVKSKTHRDVKVGLMRDVIRTIVNPMLETRRSHSGGSSQIEASFQSKLDSYLNDQSATLSDMSSRLLWMAHEQRERSKMGNLELIYPLVDRLETYHQTCHRLAKATPLESVHLDFLQKST